MKRGGGGGGGDEFFCLFWDLLHLLVWVDVRQIWFGERWDEEEEEDDDGDGDAADDDDDDAAAADDDDDHVDDGNAVDIDVSVVDIGVVEIIHAGLMMGMLSSLVCSCSRFGLNSGHPKVILFSWAYPWCGTTITNQKNNSQQTNKYINKQKKNNTNQNKKKKQNTIEEGNKANPNKTNQNDKTKQAKPKQCKTIQTKNKYKPKTQQKQQLKTNIIWFP